MLISALKIYENNAQIVTKCSVTLRYANKFI